MVFVLLLLTSEILFKPSTTVPVMAMDLGVCTAGRHQGGGPGWNGAGGRGRRAPRGHRRRAAGGAERRRKGCRAAGAAGRFFCVHRAVRRRHRRRPE